MPYGLKAAKNTLGLRAFNKFPWLKVPIYNLVYNLSYNPVHNPARNLAKGGGNRAAVII